MRSVISALFRVQESGFISFFSIRGRRLLALIASVALLIGGLSLQGASAADATNLYVKTSGDDGKDCLSEANACKTIQAAINKALSGAVINVAAGRYSENVTVNKKLTILGPNADTRPSSADGAAQWPAQSRAVIEGVTDGADGGKRAAVVWVTPEADGTDLRGFEITVASGKKSRGIGVTGAGDLDGLTIENNYIHDTNYSAMYVDLNIGKRAKNVTVRGNLVSESIREPGVTGLNFWYQQGLIVQENWVQGYERGISLDTYDGTDEISFSGNVIQDIALRGLQIAGRGSASADVVVEGNSFINVNSSGSVPTSSSAEDSGMIRFHEDLALTGEVVIANNLFEQTDASKKGSAIAWNAPTVGVASSFPFGKVAIFGNGFAIPADAKRLSIFESGTQAEATLNATGNFWNLENESEIIGSIFFKDVGQVSVDYSPWITNYVDDPAKAGQPGFWPLVGAVQREIPQTDDPVPPITLNNFVTGNTVTLTFGSGIAAGGALTVSAFDGSAGTGEFPVPVSGFQLGDPPVYFTFEKDATFDPKPPFEVCFSVPASNATNGDPVLYRNPNIAGGDEPWERVAEQSYAAGDPGTLCATLTSFSTYAVAAPEPKPDPDPEPSVTASPSPTPTATATPTPTPTPTPGPTVDKKRQRATARAALPKRIKASGVTVIAPRNPRTNAGKRIATTVKCTPRGSQAAGETRFCTVIRGPQGKVSLRTFGNPVRVVVRQTAPATGTYLPFVKRAVYVKGRQR